MISARMIKVYDIVAGSELVADVSAGATSILVDDINEFEWDGGTLTMMDEDQIGYTVPDPEESGQIDLDTPLANAHSAGVFVKVDPEVRERWMDVLEPNGEETVALRVPQQLIPLTWTGLKAPEEQTEIEFDEVGNDQVAMDMLREIPRLNVSYGDTTEGLPSDGSAPASSPTVDLRGGPGFLWASWDEIDNMDPVMYDVHVDDASGFTPDDTNKVASVAGTGYIIKALADGSSLEFDTTYYVRLVARDYDGSAPAGVEDSAQLVRVPSDETVTDSAAPASSPTPTIKGGPTFIVAEWIGVANNDPVVYEVHISTSSGFTPNSGTKYAETSAEALVIKTTAGGSALAYGTTYYVKLIAKDADGPAAASAEGSGQMIKISGGTGGDITAGSIIGDRIAALTITGGLIAGATVTADKMSVTTLSSITANVGTLTAGTIDASGVTVINLSASNITTGTLAAARIAAASIDASKLNVSQLSAISANLGTITAGTVTGATIQTASSGQRSVMDGSGFRAYGSDGTTVVINIPNSGSPTFTGTLRTDDLAITGSSPAAAVAGWQIGTSVLSPGPLFEGRVGSALSPPAYARITSGHGTAGASNTSLLIEDDWGSAQPQLNKLSVTLRGGSEQIIIDGNSTSIFVQLSSFSGSTIADLQAIEALTGTGLPARTAANTWALRNIAAGTGISVTNPAGIAGDPSIAIDTSLIPRLNVINTFTARQVVAPATDVPAQDFQRGTNTSPTANITRWLTAGGGSTLCSISPEGYGNFPQGIGTQVAAGPVTDANYGAQAASGSLGIDTTNTRIYARFGTQWRFAPTQTAIATYTAGAFTTARALNATASATLANINNVLATLLADLRNWGIVA